MPHSPTPPVSISRPGSKFKPARITRIETPYAHALHAYQGLCPWNPAGTHLVYAGLDEETKSTRIVIRDLGDNSDNVVGETAGCDYHTAVYQQWILNGAGVVYRDTRGEIKGSTIAPAPGSSLAPAFLPSLQIRAVAPSTRHGYGYSLEDPISAMRADFTTGKVERYFDAGEAARHLTADIAEPCEYSFSHFVPNKDETLAFIKVSKPEPHRKRPGQMDDWGAFFIYNLKDGGFLCLGDRISGHPQWNPEGTHIVNIMQPLDGSDNRWLVAVDAVSGAVQRLVDFPIEGPGHPVVSPDGRYLATDAYLANRQCCPIYLIDLSTGAVSEIARFDHSTKLTSTYQPGTIHRSNLHPVWSPDGSKLLVNANEGGTRLGMYLLEDFLA